MKAGQLFVGEGRPGGVRERVPWDDLLWESLLQQPQLAEEQTSNPSAGKRNFFKKIFSALQSSKPLSFMEP